MRSRRPIALSGIAAANRALPRVAIGVTTVAAATLLLAGCSADDEGTVRKASDGTNYVLPDDARRPEYRTREDCIADVTEQLNKLRADGNDVNDDPESLCESSDAYPGHYHSPWIGPILWGSALWNSGRVASWSPVRDGGFSWTSANIQPDVVQRAPSGAAPGDRAPLKGGFGTSGKAGIGGAGAREGGSVGG
ncbi:hypothetical protein [Leifsonia sp. LS-T14]|uniref:hypothetical protein n=1 Tax=unclassified Leifsonia TaxID=2663824 RepID=UPI0035A61E29